MANITLKGNPIRTNGELPKVGEKSPDFQLVDKDLGNKSLKNFIGKRKLLSIVPSLDTSVCSMMAKKLNEAVKDHPEVFVLVISADLPFAQGRFCEGEDVENAITLSMMRSKDFAKDYGMLIEDGPLAGICGRAIVVLNEEDEVVYTELVPEITQEPDYSKALSHLLV